MGRVAANFTLAEEAGTECGGGRDLRINYGVMGFLGGGAISTSDGVGSVLLVAHLAFVAWYAATTGTSPWLPPNLRPLDGVHADLALGLCGGRAIGGSLACWAPLSVLL